MNKKKALVFVIFVIVIVFFIWLLVFNIPAGEVNEDDNKITVVASFYPIYFLAKEIAGEKANVYNITPAGAEPHDFEPSARDFAKIENSDILFVNGSGFESWAINIRKIELSEGIAGNGLHPWINPVLYEKMADKVMQELARIDFENSSYYEQRVSSLKEKIKELDSDFMNGLANCKNNKIVTSHSAFGYLAQEYGFSEFGIAGLSPEQEPSIRQIAEIADFVRQNNIKYIFFETLASPKFSQTIAKETGAQVLALNPLEGLTDDEIRQGKDYFSIMQENLANLRIAMQCQ